MKTALATVVLLTILFTGHSLPATTYQITDLGTLGGTTSYAFGVNIHCDVVGSSMTATGAEHAYLLSPLPEPSTLLLAIAALPFSIMLWRKLCKPCAYAGTY